MRIYRIRNDVLICLIVAYLVTWGAGTLTERVAAQMYENYVESNRVADGEIGGIAGEEVFRVQSVEDILSHDRFTMVADINMVRVLAGGYFGRTYLRQLPLPSGETVAVSFNFDSLRKIDSINFLDDIYLMPVGRVVYADLSGDESLLNQIEGDQPLTRKDFYIDMQGRDELIDEEPYIEKRVGIVKTITAIVTFPLIHWLGASVGVFPYIFMPRRLRNKKRFD